jgi:hypothetical protein
MPVISVCRDGCPRPSGEAKRSLRLKTAVESFSRYPHPMSFRPSRSERDGAQRNPPLTDGPFKPGVGLSGDVCAQSQIGLALHARYKHPVAPIRFSSMSPCTPPAFETLRHCARETYRIGAAKLLARGMGITG